MIDKIIDLVMNSITSVTKVLIALAATVLTSTAFAVNWVQVSQYYEIDTESILRQGSLTSFWGRRSADEPSDASSVYLLYNFKCATKEFRIRSIVKYDSQGKVISSNMYEKPFEPLIPGSHGDYLHSIVCTLKR